MNEDVFNMQIRKFLKKVGVTSQREIEKSVTEAIQAGRLKGSEALHATMTLRLPELDMELTINDTLDLE